MGINLHIKYIEKKFKFTCMKKNVAYFSFFSQLLFFKIVFECLTRIN